MAEPTWGWVGDELVLTDGNRRGHVCRARDVEWAWCAWNTRTSDCAAGAAPTEISAQKAVEQALDGFAARGAVERLGGGSEAYLALGKLVERIESLCRKAIEVSEKLDERADVRRVAQNPETTMLAAGHDDLGWLRELSQRLRTQDNRITAEPVFVVQQRHRIYGFDPAYVMVDDEIAWVEDCNNCYAHHKGDEEWEAAERHYREHHTEPDGMSRTGWQDSWDFVTACFTEQGCKDYIECNGHNLSHPRIYVDTGHRNLEWQRLRRLLLEFGAKREPGGEIEARKEERKADGSSWPKGPCRDPVPHPLFCHYQGADGSWICGECDGYDGRKRATGALVPPECYLETCSNPAACVGESEGDGKVVFVCDEHCGHGGEDGWCVPIERAFAELADRLGCAYQQLAAVDVSPSDRPPLDSCTVACRACDATIEFVAPPGDDDLFDAGWRRTKLGAGETFCPGCVARIGVVPATGPVAHCLKALHELAMATRGSSQDFDEAAQGAASTYLYHEPWLPPPADKEPQ